jgi:hypothetical protein
MTAGRRDDLIRPIATDDFVEWTMMVPSNSQRRHFFRIQFPLAEQPRWIVGESSFVVVDLAEASCRLERRGHEAFDGDQSLCGNLRFADGDQVWVEGKPFCQDSDGIVVQFSKGVSLKKITALQRELLQKYPARREAELPADSR